MLELFAKLKGYSNEEAKVLATNSLSALDIMKFGNQVTKGYSGGTKRKLSVSIALVSSPKIVYLDEASAGIDPASRHHLVSILRNHINSNALT